MAVLPLGWYESVFCSTGSEGFTRPMLPEEFAGALL